MPPRGRSLGHALLGSPTRGLMGCPGGRQGRAHLAHRLPEERQRPCRRYGPATTTATANPGIERGAAGCAMAVRRQGAAGAATLRVEGHRDGPFTPPGGGATLWPSWSPLVRSAGSAAARFGEHGTVWAIRKFPSIVHGYQSPIPRLARTAVGVPTNRPRSIDAGHDLEDDVSARLRGSGRDQTVTAARSRTDRQPGWLDGEPPLKPPANRSTPATTLGLPRTWRTPRPW
jgi:hypothetical protein